MDVSVKSDARLDVSVSFGKFENDALSWEKWSSFSQNKYLEEVGSLSTPGSVAQKKAYFEAHYKKIAARKAEDLEQEEEQSTHTNTPFSSSDFPSKAYSVESSSETDVKLGSFSNGQKSKENITEETCGSVLSGASVTVVDNAVASNGQRSVEEALSSVTISDEVEDNAFEVVEQGVSINGLIDGEKAKAAIFVESVEESKDHLPGNVVDTESDTGKEATSVDVETNKNAKKVVAKIQEKKKGIQGSNSLKKEKPKLNSRNLPQKVTPIKEKDVAAVKRKVIAPSAKSLPASNRTQPKPTLMSTSLSSTQSLKKKMDISLPPKSKDPVEGRIKKTAPTSLHMSLSLGPANYSSSSSSSIPVTRKSLIMEKMGDKDIVKRAFKAFQNRANGSSTAERQVSSPASEPKLASSRSHGKVNEGLRNDAKKPATPKSASSVRSNPLPSSSSRKNLTSISPASGLRRDERAEKRQEFLKKLEARSIARTAENARTRAKSKEDKVSGIKRLTQSLNIKGKSFSEDQEKRR